MARIRILGTLLAFGCLLSSMGCVERLMTISTVPEGADIYLDGKSIGTSPVTVPFTFYGTREIVCRNLGHQTVRSFETLEAPYFQEFPYDLYYETLTADEYSDHRSFRYVLSPNEAADTDITVVEEKMKEAGELRLR